ncbi:MAG: hypothetical protein HPY58_04550 [Firmicutes bacterium]|nr:hypothetical protein [Bacillota bacterium]
MGNYLSDEEIIEAQKLLELYYSLPFGIDMPGPVWEQIFARIKGGTWSGKRDNRPNPDVVVNGIRYSVKTESLDHAISKKRRAARDFLGYREDLIVARPPVDELLKENELHSLDASELGARVLSAYNTIASQNWDRISILLRLRRREFIYWEIDPPIYDVDKYTWRDSGKAKGQSRNIITTPRPAQFKWTSRGSQFYVLYEIPANADILQIEPKPFTLDELLSLRHRIPR